MFLRVFPSAILVLSLFLAAPALSEDVTLTTFYPAPFGSYDELTSTGDTYLATDAASRLGVGTNAPANKLQVQGVGNQILEVRTDTNGDARIQLNNQGASNFGLRALRAAGALTIEDFTPGSLNEIARFMENGNVGFGGAPVDALDVTRNGANSTIAAERVGGQPSKVVVTAAGDAGIIGTSSNDPLSVVTNNAARVTVTTAGNVGVGTAAPQSPAPNGGATGNLDANDVFLRGVNRWASQAGGSANIVIVTGPNAIRDSTANCPNGFVVTGGGWEQTTNHTVLRNRPTANGRGWNVRTAANNRVTAYAVCTQ